MGYNWESEYLKIRILQAGKRNRNGKNGQHPIADKRASPTKQNLQITKRILKASNYPLLSDWIRFIYINIGEAPLIFFSG